MEKEILHLAENAVKQSIIKSLTEGYGNPLSKLVGQVIDNHSQELTNIIDEEFSSMITSKEFKRGLKTALNEKLAKVLISRMGGELEKQVNELKQNPVTRAKITTAINKVIEEN